MNSEIFIALGSNIGDRRDNIHKAILEVGKIPDTQVKSLSHIYETTPEGGIPQDNFFNAVIEVTSGLTPQQLLAALLEIETTVFGRKRTRRWGPRSIDLDLIFYGSTIIDMAPQLLLPHPRVHERRFVLAPLADIAPEFVHPVYGLRINELLAALPPGGSVTRL